MDVHPSDSPTRFSAQLVPCHFLRRARCHAAILRVAMWIHNATSGTKRRVTFHVPTATRNQPPKKFRWNIAIGMPLWMSKRVGWRSTSSPNLYQIIVHLLEHQELFHRGTPQPSTFVEDEWVWHGLANIFCSSVVTKWWLSGDSWHVCSKAPLQYRTDWTNNGWF